jgi:thioredoxin 1
MVMQVTDQNFEEEVLKSDLPVLVDFYANWCGPCRMVGPVVEKLSKDYEGKFKFCKLDVDTNPEMASKFRVMSIPQLLFFKAGEKVDGIVGAVPEAEIRPKVDGLI